MSNKRYETWYFYDYCEKFIKELDFVYDTYVKYIKNIFESPNIEAEKYTKFLIDNPGELVSFYPDYAFLEIQSISQERYYNVKNMKYRNLATHINLAYQMLEQFLISICRHQQEFHSRDVNIQKIKVEKLRNCIDFFKKYGLDITKLNYYNKIDELRLLQNVLKHGDGLSKKKLINLKSDIFENTTMNMYKNTIIDDTLNLSDEDLDEYVNIIKLFLNQIPKKLIHEYYI